MRTRSDPFGEGAQAASARRRRSLAIALGLLLFIALVFVVTMIQMRKNTADRLRGVEQQAAFNLYADG